MRILWILTFLLGLCCQTACTSVQVKQTLKEYNIIVKPGKNLRPRTYETGEGDVQYLDTEPARGDTLMIIIRGKL